MCGGTGVIDMGVRDEQQPDVLGLKPSLRIEASTLAAVCGIAPSIKMWAASVVIR